ncbi:helix-turn-helix domain-containing protein [Actibacterium sp. D379-3]
MQRGADVPVVGLYGYDEQPESDGLAHIERIEHSPATASWNVGMHRHLELYQAIWLESGAGRVTVDNDAHDIPAGTVVWLPAGVVHGFTFDNPSKGLVLTVSTDYLAAAIAQASDETFLRAVMQSFVCRTLTPDQPDGAALPDLLSLLEKEIRDRRPHSRGAVEALLRLMLIGVGRLAMIQTVSRPVKITDARIYQQFRDLNEAHFKEHWPIARYAGALGVTPDRLHAVCVATVGQGPRKLLHTRLLMEAKRLLIYTPLSVAEIGLQLGFNDPAYFSRFFAQKAGRNATAFRGQHRR